MGLMGRYATPATRQFADGWWTNPKRVGLNVSYLVSRQTAYQVAVERDHGRFTGNPEVIGSSVGLVPTNALVVIKRGQLPDYRPPRSNPFDPAPGPLAASLPLFPPRVQLPIRSV